MVDHQEGRQRGRIHIGTPVQIRVVPLPKLTFSNYFCVRVQAVDTAEMYPVFTVYKTDSCKAC